MYSLKFKLILTHIFHVLMIYWLLTLSFPLPHHLLTVETKNLVERIHMETENTYTKQKYPLLRHLEIRDNILY